MNWLIGIAVATVILLYAFHRLAIWAERRGWVYYRTKPRFRGSDLGLLTEIYQPSVEHVIEERASERTRGSQDESGEGDDGAETTSHPGDG